MNKMTYLVPAALGLALSLPVHGNKNQARLTDEPDTLIADTVDASYSEDDDWAGVAGADADSAFGVAPSATDSVANDPEDFCNYDDDLLTAYDTKSADYSLQYRKNFDGNITFSATLFIPDGETSNGCQKGTGYNTMASRILSAMLDPKDIAKWKADDLDKMIENKWKALKASYLDDQSELEKQMGKEFQPQSYSFRTTVTPVWQFKNKDCITYSIEDEAYTGGAHGMLYHYFFTMNEKADSVIGLTDIFKEEALPEVFKLIGEKLKVGPQAANDEEMWPSVAEVLPAPDANDYSVLTGQMQQYKGKWYPRPALTECGIVFTYPPYVKNCYAAGTIHILISYDEAKNWLK